MVWDAVTRGMANQKQAFAAVVMNVRDADEAAIERYGVLFSRELCSALLSPSHNPVTVERNRGGGDG